MDKQEKAQRFAEILLKTTHATHGHLSILELENISETAYSLADYMQAEADKREKEESEKKRADIREMLKDNNTFVEREGQHFDDVEWQPDWSQAPVRATAWEIPNYGVPMWLQSHNNINQPYVWLSDAPSFNYKGDWKNSLRKRPQGE